MEKEKRVAQLSLFETGQTEQDDKKEKLQATIDRIRGKYGKRSVQSATVMTNPLKKDKKQNPFGDKPERQGRNWDKNDM